MSLNVFIDNRDHFLSKNAIERFKKEVKLDNKLDSTKYFKEGFNFFKDKNENNINIKVVTQHEYDNQINKINLRQKLKDAQYSRSNRPKKRLESIKRTVPDNIFKIYSKIIKSYQFNIPAPDEVINNLEKHRLQISLLMNSKQKISNDAKADVLVKKYFRLLGEFLDVEPTDVSAHMPKQQVPKQVLAPIVENNDTDTEDEDEPQLV